MKKPPLSFLQIWNMSFGFMGIQFGFALQNANTSRIFETLGANVEDIPILWIAAPVTGLIIQPIVGHFSDKTWNRLGRRRPYFLVGAILASLALIMMPNSPVLWVAAGMLWIMDASINISMEPFRAFVGDMLPNEQRTMGFAMQSFFIGIGAVVASVLPWVLTNWFNVANTAPEGVISNSVKWSFYLGALAFFTCVVWTVRSTKEYSPEELEAFERTETETKEAGLTSYDVRKRMVDTSAHQKGGIIWTTAGVVTTLLNFFYDIDKKIYVLTVGIIIYGLLQFLAVFMSDKKENGLVMVMNDLKQMPETMKQLAVVQFFTWLALFAMWIYSTNAIATHVYGAKEASSALYNDGADWVGVLFGIYNGFAAVVALLLPVLAKKTNRKITHTVALCFGGLGLISIYFISNPTLLILPMLGVGLAWASILSMPYAILTGSLPANRMGTFMGIFNFFIVIPQILAASILGFMVEQFFGGQAIFVLIFGGISMIIAGVLTLRVNDVDAINT